LWFALPRAQAEDSVHLAPEGGANGGATVRGTVLDYTGQMITIERGPGDVRRYPSGRVRDIETKWTEPHQAGREALARHEYAAAVRHLSEADRVEPRVWARRIILAELMRCYEALGQPQQAGGLFLTLAQSDPATPAYGAAPLAWFADDRVSRTQAEAWLGMKEQPAALLVGASYLLATSAGGPARNVLTELIGHSDPRVAGLAETQLWRADVLRATPADAARWAQRIERMPEAIRAGPYFVLGQVYDRLNMADEAALAYLRAPITSPTRPELAARALIAAGRVTGRSGHAADARRLWEEVLRDYPQSPQAAEARQLLEARALPD
jgi:tetratricopeptide (TPR) repeat protein